VTWHYSEENASYWPVPHAVLTQLDAEQQRCDLIQGALSPEGISEH